MRRSPKMFTAAAALLGLLAPSLALAALPAAVPSQSVLVSLYGADSVQTSASAGSLSVSIPSYGVVATSSLALTGGVGVYSYTTQSNPLTYRTDAESSSYLEYFIDAAGPSGGTVTLDVSGSTGISTFGGIYQISSGVYLISGGLYVAEVAYSCHNGGSFRGCAEALVTPSGAVSKALPDSGVASYGATFDYKIPVSANQVYEVYLESQVEDGSDCATGDACTGIAFADPLIQIDPSTPDAGAYQVELSSGVSNALGPYSLSVPEPTGWALMLTGLGLVGGALRGRVRRGLGAA